MSCTPKIPTTTLNPPSATTLGPSSILSLIHQPLGSPDQHPNAPPASLDLGADHQYCLTDSNAANPPATKKLNTPLKSLVPVCDTITITHIDLSTSEAEISSTKKKKKKKTKQKSLAYA
ncbi:hypothetical protein CROQUDRAFT_95825 [Cronartium quercuum f. sp. fusiforme G11]|uniref:Uncharacterized protein n=1 Tax=Cronartium quercuum f. sp. fusiforme G11 TaxID=708437 RepID=A0A9P6T936_9BASI|nr:hypothetical protein CROQUDRAFT_95825 [Cronartium quercuum f. sp. fusiforme G11]